MKKTLLNSLLVAVGLLAGTMGAMAQTTTLYERGTSTETAWSADNLSDFTASGGTYALTDYGAQLSSSNGTYRATKTITPTANSIINVEAVWLGMSNTGRAYGKGNASYFRFGNIYILENDQDKASAYSLTTFSSSNYTTFTGPTGWRSYDASTRPFYVIKMEINTANNVLNYLRVYSSSDETKALLELTDQQLTDADYTTIEFGYIRSGSVSTTQIEILKSIKVTETAQTVQTAEYKKKFVDESGTEIKTTDTLQSVVGNDIILTDADKADIYTEDGTKYIYKSDDSEGKTVLKDGTAVVTITFRKAGTWNYTVNAVDADNTVLKVLGKGTCFEGDKVYVPYSEYINVNGTLYQSSAQNQSFKQSVTMTADNMVANVSYAKTAITNVAFYTEGEDIEGVTIINTGNADARCSNAAAGFATEDLKFVTLPAGVYQITANVYSPTSAGGSYAIKNGEEELFSFTSGNSNRTSKTSDFIWLTEETELSISAGSKSYAYDLIYIQSIPTEPLAITSAGYATFVPTSNVKIPAAVKAYTVKVNDDNATITLGDIAADAVVKGGTAILVEGAEGSYNFAETTATETTLADNDLVAADGTEVADGTQYGLAQVEGKVGFHKIKSGETLTKGKAYLKVSAENAAKMSFFSLNGGELTAISGVEAAKAANGEFYTLQGVRVAKPSKGLYICNGKKVIVK